MEGEDEQATGHEPVSLSPLEQLLLDGRVSEVAEAARSALASNPTDPAMLEILARALLGTDPAQAWEAASAAVSATPDSAKCLTTASVAARNSGKSSKAVDLAQRAVELAPQDSDAWATLCAGRALSPYPSHRSRAAEAGLQAVAMAPGDADCWNALGVAQDRSQNSEAARNAYLHALRIDPGHRAAKQNLAMLDRSNGDLGSAVDLLLRVVELDSSDTNAQKTLAITFSDFLGHLLWAAIPVAVVIISVGNLLRGTW